MRIAIVIERFEEGVGGVEEAALRLTLELARRELQPNVICRQTPGAEPDGVRVTRLRVPRFWQPLRILAFSRAAAAATREGFDVVHSFSRTRQQDIYRAGGGSHAAYMERVYGDSSLRRALSPRHRTILGIEEAVFRDARQIIQCNARSTEREIAERYGVPAERLATIYNGVDTNRFHPAKREDLRAKLRDELRLEGPVALFVGNDFHRKGLDRAILGLAEAAADGVLLVAGRGNTAPYRALARERGVESRTRFLGVRGDVEALHASADLLVLPTRYDAFANACSEAMASGIPVATTPANGVAELIESGVNGLVLEDDFCPAFALLREPERLQAMGRKARETAEQLTWERHADETLALYERAGR
jgi:UDP-glucose:(heptosyl)LPS alpha-1,3-glucosyltransferase